MKALYYQFVSFIQNMHGAWFGTMWLLLFAASLICVVKFFKANDGSKKKFEKVSMIFLAIVFIALLIWLSYVRK